MVEHAARGCVAMNLMFAIVATMSLAAARIASRAAAEPAANEGKTATVAAFSGAVTIAVENPGEAGQAPWLAAIAAATRKIFWHEYF